MTFDNWLKSNRTATEEKPSFDEWMKSRNTRQQAPDYAGLLPSPGSGNTKSGTGTSGNTLANTGASAVDEDLTQRILSGQYRSGSQSGSYYSKPDDLMANVGEYASRVQTTGAAANSAYSNYSTAMSEATSAKNDMDLMAAELRAVYAQYQADPSEANSKRYTDLHAQYERAVSGYATLSRTAQRYAEEYNAAAADYADAYSAFTGYQQAEQGRYDAWRGTIREEEDIQAEMDALDTRRKELLSAYENNLVNRPIDENGNVTSWENSTPEQVEELDRQRARLQEEMDWSKSLRYSELDQKEDFAENSAYIDTYDESKVKSTTTTPAMGDATSFGTVYTNYGVDDPLYAYINKDQRVVDMVTTNEAVDGSSFLGYSKEFLLHMTDQEVARYNYLYKSDPKEANRYLDYINSELYRRQREETEKYVRQFAQESPVAASVMSTLMSPLRSVSFFGQLAEYAATGKVNENAGYNKFVYSPNAIRSQVAQDISDQTPGANIRLFGEDTNVPSWLYQHTMSDADFLVNLALFGHTEWANLAMMGTGAGAQSVVEAKERGLSDGQAVALGIISAAAEIVTEKVSVEALMDTPKWNLHNIRYIIKNVLSEGSEEVASDAINLVADIIVSGSKAEFIEYAKEHGVPAAIGHQLLQGAESFLGGGLSGGLFSGLSVGTRYLTSVAERSIGREVLSSEDFDPKAAVKSAELVAQVAGDADLAELARYYGKILDSGKTPGATGFGQFYTYLLEQEGSLAVNNPAAFRAVNETIAKEFPEISEQNATQPAQAPQTAQNAADAQAVAEALPAPEQQQAEAGEATQGEKATVANKETTGYNEPTEAVQAWADSGTMTATAGNDTFRTDGSLFVRMTEAEAQNETAGGGESAANREMQLARYTARNGTQVKTQPTVMTLQQNGESTPVYVVQSGDRAAAYNKNRVDVLDSLGGTLYSTVSDSGVGVMVSVGSDGTINGFMYSTPTSGANITADRNETASLQSVSENAKGGVTYGRTNGQRPGQTGPVVQRAGEQGAGVSGEPAERGGSRQEAGRNQPGNRGTQESRGWASHEVEGKTITAQAAAGQSVSVLDKAVTQDHRDAEALAKKNGANVSFYKGYLQVDAGDGNTIQVRGVYDPATGRIYVMADGRVLAIDLTRHELMHDKIDQKTKAVNGETVTAELVYTHAIDNGYVSEWEFWEAVKIYSEIHGISSDAAALEIVCDGADHINDIANAIQDGAYSRTRWQACADLMDRVLDGLNRSANELTNNAFEMGGENTETERTAGQSDDIKYSAAAFESRYDAWVNEGKPDNKRLYICDTPAALAGANIPQKPVYINTSKIINEKKGIQSKHPYMDDDHMKQVVNVIMSPVLVMESKTQPNRAVFLGEVYVTSSQGENVPVVAAVELRPYSHGYVLDKYDVVSAYAKEGPETVPNLSETQDFVDTSNILYIDPDIKRTQNWLDHTGLQLPFAPSQFGVINSMAYFDRDVKGNFTAESKTDGLPEWKKKLQGIDLDENSPYTVEKSGTKFSMALPVEETDRFIALHNMSEEAMRGALELGGMAMPSIALTRSDAGHDTYGPISAVFGKSSVSPTDRRNRIYSGDAYTPTFPDVGYKISEKVSRKARDTVRSLLEAAGVPKGEMMPALDTDNGQDKIKRYGSFADAYKDEDGMKLAFLQDTGRGITIPMQEKRYTDLADIRSLRQIMKNTSIREAYEQGYDELKKLEPEIRRYVHDYAVEKYGETLADKIHPLDKALSYNELDRVAYAVNNLYHSGETRQIDRKKLETRIGNAMKTKSVQAAYTEWLNRLGEGFVEKKGIRNERDFFTPSGNRRSFEQLYYDYTLANIVKSMQQQVQQGKTSFLTGSGNIRGAAAKTYGSIEEARQEIGRIRNMGMDETKDEAYQAFDDKCLDLCNRMVEGRGHNRWGGAIDAAEVLTETLAKYKTEDSIYRYLLREYGPNGGYYNITREIAHDAAELVKEAQQLPVSYLEAKLYRAVPLNEPLAYVVPDNMGKALLQQMKDEGLNVLTYKDGDREDRLAKVNSVEGAKFSRALQITPEQDAEYMAAVEAEDTKKAQRMVDEAAKAAGYDLHLYHGSKKGGGFTVFKGWQYFTGNKRYAERYAQRGNEKSLYEVYAKSDRMFDTRNEEDRAVFKEYRGEYGMGEIQASGLPDWTDGYDLSDMIEENDLDYDGIILDEGGDFVDGKPVSRGPSYVLRESNQIKSADPVTYDDAGNVIPLSERFNQEEQDIRYSRVPASIASLQRENENLREQVEKWRNETKLTKEPTARQDDVRRVARALVKDYDSTLKAADIETDLMKLVQYIMRGESMFTNVRGDISWETVKEMGVNLARRIIESSQVLNEGDDPGLYREIRKALKKPMVISDMYAKDIAPDGFGEWYRRNHGRVNVAINRQGMPVDTAYQELSATYPEWFPADITNPADQVRQMLDVVNTLEPVYENPYSFDMAMAIEEAANDIIDRAISEEIRQTSLTFADRQQKKLEETKAKYIRRIQEIREQRDQQMADLRRHYREVRENERQRKYESEAQKKLLRIARRLKGLKTTAANRELIQSYIGDLDLVARNLTGAKQLDLLELRRWYEDQQKNNPDFLPDKNVEEALKRLERKQIGKMDLEDVLALTKVLSAIENEIRTNKKLIDAEDRRDTAIMGQQIIQDVQQTGGASAVGLGKLMDKLVTNTLSAVREIRRLVGYADNDPLYQATIRLQEGETKALDYQMRAEKRFTKFLEDKKFIDRIAGKNAEEITISGIGTNGPETVKITPAMRMSLYLHSRNVQNMKHITGGGITVPNMELLKKGDVVNAYDKGRTIKLTPSQVRQITDKMTQQERDFALAAYDYFNGMSQKEINEVSEKLKGYSLATVENYFPINTDPDFLGKETTGLKYDGTIPGMGFLQERVDAKNAILLLNMNDVLDRSIRDTAKYVGLAIPVRNMNKLLGVTMQSVNEDGTVDYGSVKSGVRDAIGNVWGKEGKAYLDKLLTDLQNPKHTESNLLSALRSNYAKAVLNMNFGVAMKQMASYPTAGAVLGYKALRQGLTDLRKVDEGLIARYTPLLWYRSRGFANPELGDIAKQGKSIPRLLNWIQGADRLTTKRLWRASEHYVQNNNKSLTPGTDAFYKEVAKVYNQVITETQPNYTTMERPQILRSEDTLKQALVMFKTQPFQNFNVLYDAIGDLAAKRRAWANTGTADAKRAYQEAAKTARNAVVSQIVQLAVFAGMNLAWAMVRGKLSKYKKKDEDELTVDSVLAGVGKDMAGGVFSMVPGGTELWDLISAFVFGDKYYGIDVASVSAVSDAFTSLYNAAEHIQKIASALGDEEQKVDWDKERRFFGRLGGQLAKLGGFPLDNITNLFSAVFLRGAQAAVGKDMGQYAYLRLTGADNADYYDLLYKNYKKDTDAYSELYDRMIDDGFTEKNIRENMEKRMKAAQGVSSVDDLDHRYMGPEQQDYYDGVLKKVRNAGIWNDLDADLRDKAKDLIYYLAINSDESSAKTAREKVDGGESVGLSMDEYIIYWLARQYYDQPVGVEGHGGYDRDELIKAIDSVPGLSIDEKSYLWSVYNSKTHTDKNNPYR